MTAGGPRVRWIVAGVVVVLVAGFAGGQASVHQPPTGTLLSPETTQACDADHDQRSMTSTRQEPSRTPSGAVVAATSYATSLDGPDLLDPARRRQLIRRTAAVHAQEDLTVRLGNVAAMLSQRLGLTPDVIGEESFVWRPMPAGWRVVRYEGVDATVAIWGTGVAMVDGRLLAPIAWRTTLVDVTWEQGRWRLAGFRSEAGPEPPRLGGADPSRDVASEIRRFSPFVLEPGAEDDA